MPKKIPCTFVIIDNHPHLTKEGVTYLSNWLHQCIIVTTNPLHPAFQMNCDNIHIMKQERFDVHSIFEQLETTYDIHELCIQSGAMMNGLFLREHLIDYLDIVVAPILIGGIHTPTLIDGASLQQKEELQQLESLKLQQCSVLEENYIRLQYEVSHNQ